MLPFVEYGLITVYSKLTRTDTVDHTRHTPILCRSFEFILENSPAHKITLLLPMS